MPNQQHQSSLVRSRTNAAKPCIGDRFRIAKRSVVAGRFNVFAFEHTPRRWERWSHFETKSEALIYCRGKFPASCGVRVATIDKNGLVVLVNPFPKAEPCLPCRVEFAS
jgi:hypothetical protein